MITDIITHMAGAKSNLIRDRYPPVALILSGRTRPTEHLLFPNLFPHIDKLAYKAVITLARSPVLIQFFLGAFSNSNGGCYLVVSVPIYLFHNNYLKTSVLWALLGIALLEIADNDRGIIHLLLRVAHGGKKQHKNIKGNVTIYICINKYWLKKASISKYGWV